MTRIRMGAEELVELGRAKCGRGKIRRSGYRRSDGTYVKPTCVPDKGAPGKTSAAKRVLPEPVPGDIGPWKRDMTDGRRHVALERAVERRGCRKVIGGLTLLRNLTADSGTKRTAKADAKWLHDQNFCKLKGKK
jgi:hypothetical protein